jgi:hypothetical protein
MTTVTHNAMAVLVVIALVAPQAAAQSSPGEWQYAVSPYLWAAGMDGSLAVATREGNIDVPFSDIFDNLDFALMGHFDMRNERWMLSSDLVFVDLEHRENLIEGELTAGIDMTLFEVTGGYRVTTVFTVLAGARWVDMGASLKHTGGFNPGDADAHRSWIDPFVGAHAFVPISKKWWIGLRGDVGGFGVGSELTWQAWANLGFRASHLVSIVLGYHALDMDYEDGSGVQYVNLDLMISGPQLGVAFTF